MTTEQWLDDGDFVSEQLYRRLWDGLERQFPIHRRVAMVKGPFWPLVWSTFVGRTAAVRRIVDELKDVHDGRRGPI